MAAATFESGHADMVHDAQLDYYGRRLATCSSDRTIKIFEVSGENRTPVADLHGHEGPVWQISWAHPKFGTLLASCSFDHKVIIWRESPDNQWSQVRAAERAPWHHAFVPRAAPSSPVPPPRRSTSRPPTCTRRPSTAYAGRRTSWA